ncbi:hypothetical protein C8Q74DRAFT_1219573 [Fomes fomentarius]|nr:hypothetical protein C8Q74DRAFT_1219573 [Fomes fomentarius]
MTLSLQTVDMSNVDNTVVSDADDRVQYHGTWKTIQIHGQYKSIHGTKKVGDRTAIEVHGTEHIDEQQNSTYKLDGLPLRHYSNSPKFSSIDHIFFKEANLAHEQHTLVMTNHGVALWLNYLVIDGKPDDDVTEPTAVPPFTSGTGTKSIGTVVGIVVGASIFCLVLAVGIAGLLWYHRRHKFGPAIIVYDTGATDGLSLSGSDISEKPADAKRSLVSLTSNAYPIIPPYGYTSHEPQLSEGSDVWNNCLSQGYSNRGSPLR